MAEDDWDLSPLQVVGRGGKSTFEPKEILGTVPDPEFGLWGLEESDKFQTRSLQNKYIKIF